jgi:hypothetical protein
MVAIRLTLMELSLDSCCRNFGSHKVKP